MKRRSFQANQVADCWIADGNAEVCEVWHPADVQPLVIDERLVLLPTGAPARFEIDVRAFFEATGTSVVSCSSIPESAALTQDAWNNHPGYPAALVAFSSMAPDGDIKVTLYSDNRADVTKLDLLTIPIGSVGATDKKVKLKSDMQGTTSITPRFDRQASARLTRPSADEHAKGGTQRLVPAACSLIGRLYRTILTNLEGDGMHPK